MNVKILETGEIKTLSIIDRETGVDWVADLLGNAGAFNDGQFVQVDDEPWLATSQDTYDWWKRYIDEYEQTEFDIDALAEELDIDRSVIAERVQEYGGYEDRRLALKVMDAIREEYGE